MEFKALSSHTVDHIGIVVRDIEQSKKAYAEIFGLSVPNTRITATADVSHIQYRGQSTPGRAKLAFFHMEVIRIELIEPLGGPSTWEEFLEKNGPGVHHVAFRVGDEDMEKEIVSLKQRNISLVQRGDFTGGSYAYFDSQDAFGVILELIQSIKK